MLRTPVDVVRTILREDPGSVLGAPEPDPRMLAPHRFDTTVAVELGAGTSTEQAVVIELGRTPADEQQLAVAISWEATEHERILPSFTGELVVDPDGGGSSLTLRGTYSIPFGPVGRFGDAVVGHRVARATMSDFAARLARRIDDEARRTAHLRDQLGRRS